MTKLINVLKYLNQGRVGGRGLSLAQIQLETSLLTLTFRLHQFQSKITFNYIDETKSVNPLDVLMANHCDRKHLFEVINRLLLFYIITLGKIKIEQNGHNEGKTPLLRALWEKFCHVEK